MAWSGQNCQDLHTDPFLTASGDLGKLAEGLGSVDPLVRYWSAQGCLNLGVEAAAAAPAMGRLAADEHSSIRITVARYLNAIGRTDEARRLAVEDLEKANVESAALDAIQALTRMDALDSIPDGWVERTLRGPNAGEYTKKFAARLQNERRGGG